MKPKMWRISKIENTKNLMGVIGVICALTSTLEVSQDHLGVLGLADARGSDDMRPIGRSAGMLDTCPRCNVLASIPEAGKVCTPKGSIMRTRPPRPRASLNKTPHPSLSRVR